MIIFFIAMSVLHIVSVKFCSICIYSVDSFMFASICGSVCSGTGLVRVPFPTIDFVMHLPCWLTQLRPSFSCWTHLPDLFGIQNSLQRPNYSNVPMFCDCKTIPITAPPPPHLTAGMVYAFRCLKFSYMCIIAKPFFVFSFFSVWYCFSKEQLGVC